MSSLSETDRNVQAVNAELARGGIQGTIHLADTDNILVETLATALETLKKMNGRSNDIMAAVYSGDAAVTLRRILTTLPINWSQVKAHVDKVLLPASLKKLVPDVIPEFELARDVANDYLTITSCTQALSSVGPMGSPEKLDTSKISTTELNEVCESVNLDSDAPRSDKCTQLISACRLIKGIRDNLVKANANKSKGENTTMSMAAVAKTVEAYRNVKSLVATAYKVHKSNVSDAAWVLIKGEVNLAIKAAHIWEARSRIEDAVNSATKVYSIRASETPSFGDNPKTEVAKTPVRRGSVLTQVGVDVLSTFDLDRFIDEAYKMDMVSNALGGYIECAQSIRRVRNCVIDQDWDLLRKLKHDQVVQNELNMVPAAGNRELDNAIQEYLNKDAQDSLERMLNTAFDADQTDLSIAELEKCILSIENVSITSAVSKQYLECARQVLRLRKGMHQNDAEDVNEALKWFTANPGRYPLIVQEEVVVATQLHENNQVMKGLLEAISTGAASGSLDNRDFSTVVTTDLSRMLKQAKKMSAMSPEVEEFVRTAEGVFALRCAQQMNDFDSLRRTMAGIMTMQSIHPLVIDEVAAARADVENDNIVQILTAAVLSFEEDAPGPGDGPVSKQALFGMSSSAQAPAKSRKYSYLNMNVQDIDRDTIDVETLREAIATAEAFGVHTFSQEAKRLLRTVRLLLRIREAMKVDDWDRIRQIIDEQEMQGAIASTSKMSKSTAAFGAASGGAAVPGFVDFTFASSEDHSIDVLADKEIQLIHAQLEMRNSLAAVMKYIGPEHGAKCCYGLVDIQPLLAVELYNATEKAVRSVAQEQQLTAQKQKKAEDEFGGSVVSRTPFGGGGLSSPRARASQRDALAGKNEETKLLLSSAKHLAEVRMLLYKGQYEAAGVLAERIIFNVNNNGNNTGTTKDLPTKLHPAVMDELYLYATEVGEALVSSRICKLLFQAKQEADLEELLGVVEYAVMERNGELWDQDLGLVRLIDLSLKRLGVLNGHFTSVVQAMGGSDTRLLKRVIRVARAHNVSDELLELAQSQVSKLKEYEDYVAGKCALCGGGIVTGVQNHRDIIAKAASFGLESHMLARRSASILSLHPMSKRIANVVRAVAVRNLGVVVRETMAMKRSFLEQPSSVEAFELKKYPLLRPLEDFGMRMTLESGELKDTMLLSTDKNIPTSLTRLSPPLAVYGVYVFIHCIRPLQEHVYTVPQVILRNLVLLGRYCPPMRDEIYLQIAKQLRNNPKTEECDRLWRILGVCLKYFPPSIELENYLERFLIECYGRNGSIVDAEALAQSIAANSYRPNLFLPSSIPSKLSSGSSAAKQVVPEVKTETHEFMVKSAAFHCIYAMHSAIIRFGYGSRISTPCDITLDMCRRWLSRTDFDIDLTPARIVPSEEPTGTGLAPTKAAESSSGSNGAGGQAPTHMCPFDGLFTGYEELTAKGAARLVAAPNRGSKENWQRRFYLFSQNKDAIDCDTFVASLCNGSPTTIIPVSAKTPGGGRTKEEAGARIDRKDYQVLLLIVTGQYPTHKSALIREYLHEYNNYLDIPIATAAAASKSSAPGAKSPAEALADAMNATVNSSKRRNILKKVIYPPKIKPEDKFVAAAQFWKRVVVPILAIGAAPPVPLTTAASSTAGTGADTARKSSKEELLATPPGKVSAWTSKFGKSATTEEPKPKPSAMPGGRRGSKDGEDSTEAEPQPLMTWSVYRDVILAGIEWLIDHEMDA